MDHDLTENVIALARENISAGRIIEPRVFYDSLTMPATAGQIVQGNPDVFRNGEQFPVRITHILAAYRPTSNEVSSNPDERILQRANLRISQHDHFYMNRNFVPLPLWSNVVVAGPDVLQRQTATWHFMQPFIIATRDTMLVQLVLEFAVASGARTAGVSFMGYGLVSKQPIFVGATAELTNLVPATLPTDRFRNDGAEPWVITDMVISCSAESTASGAGDIRQLRLQLRQVGNGTNADWCVGPIGAVPLPQCPAFLFGKTTGRALVHRIPGDGWLWEPGEGVSVEATESVTSNECRLAIGMLGHIEVT